MDITTSVSTPIPKSILKKTAALQSPSTPTKTSPERAREIAIYHATILQARKDIELTILISTEILLDYPNPSSGPNPRRSPSPSSAPPTSHPTFHPSTSDISSLKERLLPFQPSDFDTLISERNIAKKCGWVLCPNSPTIDHSLKPGSYRLLNTRGSAKDFKIIKKEELERWCCKECAEQAMYVRIQLDDTPAWEREKGGGKVQIELLSEKFERESREREQEQLERLNGKMRNMELGVGGRSPEEEQRDLESGMRRMGLADEADLGMGDLAMERGDENRPFAKKRGRVEVQVVEKDIGEMAIPPSLEDGDEDAELIEGHRVNFSALQ